MGMTGLYLQKLKAGSEIGNIRADWLGRGVGDGAPRRRKLAIVNALEDSLELRRHDDLPMDGLDDSLEGRLNGGEQAVVPDHLLGINGGGIGDQIWVGFQNPCIHTGAIAVCS